MENNANEDEDLYSEESIKKLIEQVYKTTPLHVPFCLKCLKCGHPQEKCVSRKDKYGKLLPFVNGDQRSKQSARRARPENSLRGVSFCRWLKDLVSQENLSNGCILDVAGGGKGGLSFQLAINEDIKCVVVDPRIVKFKKKHRRRLNHQIKKKKGRVWDFDFDLFIDNPFEDELFQILFEQEMKEEHFQKIKQNIERNRELEELENQSDGDESEDIDEDQYDEESEDMDASEDSDKNDIENEIILDYTSSFCSIHENLAYVEHMINLPNQILAWFDEDFVLKYPKLWEECSLVLGMHPDQATEPIVDLSLKYNKPFAIVPCCVFPNSNPHRKLKTGENVRSYEQFCQYLLEKDERIKSFDISQFQGRNKVIYKL